MQQPGETMAERKARLKALRQAKDAAEGAPEEKKDGDEEPVLKFRNYLPKDEVLSEGLIKATRAPEFEPVVAKPLPVAEEVSHLPSNIPSTPRTSAATPVDRRDAPRARDHPPSRKVGHR
jgi:hypothetical protein